MKPIVHLQIYVSNADEFSRRYRELLHSHHNLIYPITPLNRKSGRRNETRRSRNSTGSKLEDVEKAHAGPRVEAHEISVPPDEGKVEPVHPQSVFLQPAT